MVPTSTATAATLPLKPNTASYSSIATMDPDQVTTTSLKAETLTPPLTPARHPSPQHIRLACVPEHFSSPLLLSTIASDQGGYSLFPSAQYPCKVSIVLCPGGTGEMLKKLQQGEVDVVCGLTEGLVAPLGSFFAAKEAKEVGVEDPGYRLVGTLNSKPLVWAVATHPDRAPGDSYFGMRGLREGLDKWEDVDSPAKIKEEWELLDTLKDWRKCGVSRIGSGSYLMPFVVGLEKGWIGSNPSTPDQEVEEEEEKRPSKRPKSSGSSVLLNIPKKSASDTTSSDANKEQQLFDFIPCNNLPTLSSRLLSKETDFFLWERFTTKHLFDSKQAYHYSNVRPPWPAFMFAASNNILSTESGKKGLKALLGGLNESVHRFMLEAPQKEIQQKEGSKSLEFVTKQFHYSEADALKWFQTVGYAEDVSEVKNEVLEGCLKALVGAGVVSSDVGGVEVEVDVDLELFVAKV
ncbi:hypothetical protein HDV05_003735 [Chytridiales sp. JEL 0842]|nr:hypothetical protein HDV05_003735 [Chytridiales sp. JEL 0842]